MRFTPSSTARRKTFFAFSRSVGQPQISSFVIIRIAPNPSRLTVRSPPSRNVGLLVDAAVKSFGNPPVTTAAAPAKTAAKNFRRVTWGYIECRSFPRYFSVLNLTSYFDALAYISHAAQNRNVYIWRNWREGLRSVNLGHLTRIRRHFVIYFCLHRGRCPRKGCRMTSLQKGHSRLFELPLVLVCLNDIANRI